MSWGISKNGVTPLHSKTGAHNMREHREAKRVQAEARNRMVEQACERREVESVGATGVAADPASAQPQRRNRRGARKSSGTPQASAQQGRSDTPKGGS